MQDRLSEHVNMGTDLGSGFPHSSSGSKAIVFNHEEEAETLE